MPNTNAMVSTLKAGLVGRCPQCRSGPLFASAASLSIREACPECGLDYGFVDPGDGPAVFAILVLGFVILGAALIVEFRIAPPLWVHLVVWLPVTSAVGFALLRPLKSTLVALQYHYKAEEGRLSKD